MSYLKAQFDTDSLIGQGFSRINALLVWHGPPSEDAARSIAKHGFANLSTTDDGFFGNGIYTSLDSEYACMYASEYPEDRQPNANGEWPVILAVGICGVAYPITVCRDDFPTGPLPPIEAEDCAYYGKPIKPKFDTHISPVCGPDFHAVAVEDAEYHEIVFKADAQLLPLAIVWFRRSSTGPLRQLSPAVSPVHFTRRFSLFCLIVFVCLYLRFGYSPKSSLACEYSFMTAASNTGHVLSERGHFSLRQEDAATSSSAVQLMHACIQ